MIRHGTMEDARRAVTSWRGDAESVALIGLHGNTIFSFKNAEGHLQILRFTDPTFRSLREVLAELDFVNRLHAAGVPVAPAIADRGCVFAVEENSASGPLIRSSSAFANGLDVRAGSPHWNKGFFFEWGRNLARIHEASAALPARGLFSDRWPWDRENLFLWAKDLIPADDHRSFDEMEDLFAQARELPRPKEHFGLIHADHAPQNFRFDERSGRITAFDFGNCCHHWFIADIAISLSTIRRQPNRDEIRANVHAKVGWPAS